MRDIIIGLFVVFFPMYLTAQNTISEVMFDPSTDESADEFIEIYNNADSAVSVYQWQLFINGSADTLNSPPWRSPIFDSSYLILEPQSFGIILDLDYWDGSVPYDSIIPDTVKLITIDDTHFGDLGLSNSSPRTIILQDSSGMTISEYTYSTDNPEGFSDEKMVLSGVNTDANWANSEQEFGTPGFYNSVSPLDYDLRISGIPGWTPRPATPDSTIQISIIVVNAGLEPSTEAKLYLYGDTRVDSITVQAIPPGDSADVHFGVNLPSGSHKFITEIGYPEDQDSTNNSIQWELPVRYPEHSLIINEIMYDPISGDPEWIEIQSNRSDTVNLQSWSFGDESSDIALIEDTVLIEPNSFWVLSELNDLGNYDYENSRILIPDELPNLNNGSDGLWLGDMSGAIIDTVQYSGDWGGGDGVSLERRNPFLSGQEPANWGSADSEPQATPTRQNSVLVDTVDLSLANFSVEDGPLEVGESFLIAGEIRNQGLQEITVHSIKVYDDADFDSSASADELLGSQVVSESVIIGDSFPFQISPIIQQAGFRRITLTAQLDEGPEYLLLDTSIRVRYSEQALLISEIMYTPDEEPEWIELYNGSSEPVNLFDWQIKDATSNRCAIQDFVSVGPEEYIVVTADDELTDFYDQLNASKVIELPEFPTLNNSGDSVLVISPANGTHDSLRYTSGWGGSSGNSLERKNLLAPATDVENWGTSIAEEGATPAGVNSITVPDYDLSLTNFSMETIDSELHLSATVQNVGAQSISGFTLRFFHDADEDSASELSEHFATEQGEGLMANDSVTFSLQLRDISGGYQQFIGVIASSEDTNPQNDTLAASIFIGYPSGSVAINEIMYRPESGEPEWVELFIRQDSLDPRGFLLRDDGHEAQINLHEIRLYTAGDFIVVAGDSSILQSYPDASVNLEIAQPFPTLNNGIDSLSIRDGTGAVMESLEYSSNWGGDIGVSLERINVNDSANVASNWGSSAADNGATPGAMNSIAILENDLRLLPVTIQLVPEFPEANTSWQLTVEVLNAGTEVISELSVEVFQDTSTIGDPWVSRPVQQSISPDDSVMLSIVLPGLASGRHRMALRVKIPGEQRPSDNTDQFEVTIPFESQTMLITEFAPIPGEGWSEFVEIYNPSDAAIELSGWRLGDNAALTPAFTGDLVVGHHRYAVFAEDSSVYHEFRIPDSVAYVVSDNWRSLNNTKDVVRFVDPSGRAIDSLKYSDLWEIPDGKSVERKWYLSSASSPYHSSAAANWDNSIDEHGGTPGRMNSIAVTAANSLNLIRTDTIQSAPPGKTILTEFRAVNTGLDTTSQLTLIVGFDGNADSILSEEEIRATESISGIPPADTTDVAFDIAASMYSGYRTLIAEAAFDGKTESAFSDIWIPFNPQSIIFNEFLADPSEVIPQEFTEIVNISNDSIPMGQWILAVNERRVILGSASYLLPDEYGVITEDGISLETGHNLSGDSWASLPNDGGTIRLFDQYGYLIDSLTYTEDWDLMTGRSQERLHLEKGDHSASNWKASVNQRGATPGAENSLYFNVDSANTGWTIVPSTFSPDDDGFDDLLRISYSGEAALQYATIRIFDTVGRTIKTLVRDKPAPVRQSWFWDGNDYKDRPAPIGMYLVQIEYKPMNGKQREKIETIVLAKPL